MTGPHRDHCWLMAPLFISSHIPSMAMSVFVLLSSVTSIDLTGQITFVSGRRSEIAGMMGAEVLSEYKSAIQTCHFTFIQTL
jgi:hypothetical protein